MLIGRCYSELSGHKHKRSQTLRMTALWGGLETSGVFEKVTGHQEDGLVGVLKNTYPIG